MLLVGRRRRCRLIRSGRTWRRVIPLLPPLRRGKHRVEKEKWVPKELERGEKLALPAHPAGGIGRLRVG
jgi:hypothetical protein